MDEERMLEWIDKVWLPYVQRKPALLCLDTFTGHLTERVKAAFDECGTKLLVIFQEVVLLFCSHWVSA